MKYRIAIDLFNSWDWQNPRLYKGFTVGKGRYVYNLISNIKPLTSVTKTVAIYRYSEKGLIRRYVPVDAPIKLIKI